MKRKFLNNEYFLLITLDFNYADEFDINSLWFATQEEYSSFIENIKYVEDKDDEKEIYFGTNEFIYISLNDIIDKLNISRISETTYKEMTKLLGKHFGLFSINSIFKYFYEED